MQNPKNSARLPRILGRCTFVASVIVGLFSLMLLWLHFKKNNHYEVIIEFAKTAKLITPETKVWYDGVQVGQVARVESHLHIVEVVVAIQPPDRVIPRDVEIEATQSALIGEISIVISPEQNLGQGIVKKKVTTMPLSRNCDPTMILCHRSRTHGILRLEPKELCSAKFWKEHPHEWVKFSPNDNFDAVFGVDLFQPDITLWQVLSKEGNHENEVIARAAVTVLLNATHPDIYYHLEVKDVLELMKLFKQQPIQSRKDMAKFVAEELKAFSDKCPVQ
ncbi:MAG: MlaD family protein [Aulosira sp. DedQUE10]|nr:MlaD family protein [Aulosira sp. DedQUE10]